MALITTVDKLNKVCYIVSFVLYYIEESYFVVHREFHGAS